jgi:hypothetical protein
MLSISSMKMMAGLYSGNRKGRRSTAQQSTIAGREDGARQRMMAGEEQMASIARI